MPDRAGSRVLLGVPANACGLRQPPEVAVPGHIPLSPGHSSLRPRSLELARSPQRPQLRLLQIKGRPGSPPTPLLTSSLSRTPNPVREPPLTIHRLSTCPGRTVTFEPLADEFSWTGHEQRPTGWLISASTTPRRPRCRPGGKPPDRRASGILVRSRRCASAPIANTTALCV